MAFQTPFSPSGTTDLQQNTELALHLLRDLELCRDAQARIWRGDREIRALQYTCHILEALHELNLKGLTNHLAEPAVNWLLALPLDLPADDLRAFRLYPSRFKTLAQLDKFDAARLTADLEALGQLFDAGSGWIHDAPIDLRPTVVTMLWADTLLRLESLGPLAPERRARREHALHAIERAFEQWLDRTQPDPAEANGPAAGLRPGDLANPGDASYAFELLGRAGRLRPDSPRAERARRFFTAALRAPQPADMRQTDFLYCALHLQLRLPQHAETREVVQTFLREVRQRYENDECQRESLSFHALVLRLLAAYHGEALRTGILERLWKDSLASAQAEERQEQAQLEAEFVGLVRQSIHVQLAPPQRITGTRTRGEVYRLRFGITTESTDEHGSPLSTPRDTLRLIVKKGTPEALARAIHRYRELPEPLQELFARHADLPEAHAPGYLIMQDLAEMQPLSEVLAQLDRPVILPEERAQGVEAVAESVAEVMQALHGYQHRPSLVGHQVDVIYLAPMAQALERLAQPAAFPEMQQWLQAPLTINKRKFRELEYYLRRLQRYEAQLSPHSLGYVHGDCHSRNLMLSRDFTLAKFVDIDTLSSADDYILDYGLLLEDAALYQSLPYGTERGRIDWDEIQIQRPGAAAGPENWIAYPAFPRSEAVVAFQAELLGRLRAYAERIGDTHWQPRLWLATARGLLLLASHQLTSYAAEPQRRLHSPRYVNDARLVQVAYAEAIRLLRELTDYFSRRRAGALPEMPFPGAHRPESGSPHTATVTALLSAIGPALGEEAERRPVAEHPDVTDFVTRPGQQLFVRIHAKDSSPVVYLAGRPEQLQDPHGLAEPLGTDDAALVAPGLGSRVPLAAEVPLPDIMELVRQAHQLASQTV